MGSKMAAKIVYLNESNPKYTPVEFSSRSQKWERACYRVWEINMGVCPRMEFYEIMCINILGYDCYNNGVFPCKFNSTGKL